MADQTSGGRRTGVRDRTPASSIVAELWAEREKGGGSPDRRPAPATRPPDRQPRSAGPARASAPRPARTRGGPPLGLLGLAIVAVGAAGAFVVAQGNPRPSKAEFVSKADAVCASTNGAVTAIGQASGYPELATAAATFVTATQAQLDLLGKVGLPNILDRGRARSVVSAMTATQEAGRSLQSAAASSNDALTASATRTMTAASKDAVAKAGEYGLAACAVGAQPAVDKLAAGAHAAVKVSFVSKVGALCAEAMKTVEAVPPMKGNNPAELRRYIGQTMGAMDKMTNGMRVLTPPPGDEATLNELYAAMDKTNAKGLSLVDAAIATDRSVFPKAEKEFDALSDAAGEKMDAYGLNDCGGWEG